MGATSLKMVPVPLRIREYHRAGVTLKGPAVSVRGERNSAEGAAGAKWPPLSPSTFSKGKINAANAAAPFRAAISILRRVQDKAGKHMLLTL